MRRLIKIADILIDMSLAALIIAVFCFDFFSVRMIFGLTIAIVAIRVGFDRAVNYR